ncbi:DUF3244 domain-containing protein [uncultured Bacteroides sp.]|uniref:DUF3244 domain-containing protein n=1 Tax=uncultured Bacteroides sp. TaxID=162156 RepID=UPI002588BDAC|nr:DUF3244 domain-containing protein [uncultured Bacteroides sp.]
MKLLIVIFSTLIVEFFTSMSYAEEKKIEVTEKYWFEDTRSVSYIPTITHDSNTLYIYSDIILENLNITVKNATGMLLYSNTVTILNTQRYSFTIDDMNKGEFLIELTYRKKYLYGHFNISQ